MRSFALVPSLFVAISAVVVAAASTPARASQVEVKFIDSYRALSSGTFDGTALTPDGSLRLGRQTTPLAKELTGPVMDMVEHKGATYIAVATPPRVMRLRPGKTPELIATVDAGLITALVSFGPDLVALTAPEGGAAFIDVRAKKVSQTVKLEDVKMVLDATVLGGALYAVGGGDTGVLVRLARGAKTFTTVVETKEAHLRTITADPKRNHLWFGGGDDGVIYRFDTKAKSKEGRLQALYDAAPEETTSISVDASGRVFATFVDSNGKLSKGATKRDKSDETKKVGEKKPRKIKSSEVVRIDVDGTVEVLWQSKVDGAFAGALVDGGKRLLVGTGASGKIFDIDPSGKAGAAVVARAKGADEVTSFLVRNGEVLAGTAHPGGVVRVEKKQAKRGIFVSAPLAAETLARWGRLDVDHTAPSGTTVRWSMRTGNTNDPDQTWTPYSPALIHSGNPIVDPGKYMQVKVELIGSGNVSPIARSIRAAYLEKNRAPEIDRIDMVIPNIKVVASSKEAKSKSRSVTFNDGAFKKYRYEGGSPLPKLGDRTSGKQTHAAGWRTAFAWVEDPDKDLLRFRWSMATVKNGRATAFRVVKDWSDEPFLSVSTNRLVPATYRMKVEVSDIASNGPDRAKTDSMVSGDIVATRQMPTMTGASARQLKQEKVRVRFSAKAAVPLKLAECSVGGADWTPIDSLDGMVDGEEERFETVLGGTADFQSVSCAVTDELGHRTTLALPIK